MGHSYENKPGVEYRLKGSQCIDGGSFSKQVFSAEYVSNQLVVFEITMGYKCCFYPVVVSVLVRKIHAMKYYLNLMVRKDFKIEEH